MKRTRAEAVIEAVLFTMGESVEISRLADVIEEDTKVVKDILKGMEERYAREDRGITLVHFEDAVQLCTKEDMYEYLVKIAKTPKKLNLTDTVLETLSIIAYKQPVTRAEIERVRGVNCDHAINKLLEYDLITELGRLDAPELAAEDFSFYQQRLPGLFCFLGVGDTPPLHAASFDFDEAVLARGLAFYEKLLYLP